MSVSAAGVIAGHSTLYDYIVAVLQKLNLPTTGTNVAVLSGLALSEGRGLAGWNPFDTEQKEPGSTAFNSAGVQSYTSFQQGVDATAATLSNGLYGALLTGLAEQQPLSYYISGPGFQGLKTWQRGPNGASNPPPAAVNALASHSVAQLLAYAKSLVTPATLFKGPAPTPPSPSGSSSTPSSSTPDPFGIVAAFSGLESTLVRAGGFVLGLVAFAIGLALIFGGDIEDLADKAISKIPPIPVVP